jgi:light-regulated signal transduction histidine kinase (bacteriophytochrome)
VVDGYEPYLGLHYPASDVPAPAKRLFSLSWLRHQPDIGYTPVPMIPENNPVTGGPLDMSYALLRSVSVMYTGYLKNMGTKSSMVMTLMKDGQLWGLIACHHHSNPKHVPYEIRLACEFLANMVSLLISEKEDREHSEYRLKLKFAQDKFVRSMARTGEFADSLTAKETNLLDFVHAQGAAVAADGRIITLGNTPSGSQIQFLLEWLSAKGTRDVFATDSLVSHLPEAIAFKDVASGILALRLAATKNDYLLWFRPEVIHTVKWAGDPHKPVDIADGGERLLPRTSFALWKETVRF